MPMEIIVLAILFILVIFAPLIIATSMIYKKIKVDHELVKPFWLVAIIIFPIIGPCVYILANKPKADKVKMA